MHPANWFRIRTFRITTSENHQRVLGPSLRVLRRLPLDWVTVKLVPLKRKIGTLVYSVNVETKVIRMLY